jgi:hypothetical protein
VIEAVLISHGLTYDVAGRKPRPRRRPQPAFAFFVGSATFWLAAWWLAAAIEVVPPLFLPSPAVVAARFVSVIDNGYADATLIEHAGASLFRVLAALACAFAVAVPIGIGMGLSPIVRGIIDPVIEAYRPIPPLAYLPLVVIWLGIGETAKVLLIFLAILPAIALSTASGVRGVPAERVDWVVNCSGTGRASSGEAEPVLRQVIGLGLARAGLSGRGLDVEADGAVIGRTGRPTAGLYGLGPLTVPRFLEVTAVPEIRLQCVTVAGALADFVAEGKRAVEFYRGRIASSSVR